MKLKLTGYNPRTLLSVNNVYAVDTLHETKLTGYNPRALLSVNTVYGVDTLYETKTDWI